MLVPRRSHALVLALLLCSISLNVHAGPGRGGQDLDAEKIASKDLYGVLNVSSKATQQEIKDSYKKLAREFHPDKHQNGNKEAAEAKFVAIGEAYEILSHAPTRSEYDEIRREYKQWGSKSQGGSGGGYNDFNAAHADWHFTNNFAHQDPYDLFNTFWGDSGMFGDFGNLFESAGGFERGGRDRRKAGTKHESSRGRGGAKPRTEGKTRRRYPTAYEAEKTINQGDGIVLSNAEYFARLDNDCAFGVYHGKVDDLRPRRIWNSGPHDPTSVGVDGCHAVLQENGNLVIFAGRLHLSHKPSVLWSSNTPEDDESLFLAYRSNPEHFLLLGDSGNLQICRQAFKGEPCECVWASIGCPGTNHYRWNTAWRIISTVSGSIYCQVSGGCDDIDEFPFGGAPSSNGHGGKASSANWATGDKDGTSEKLKQNAWHFVKQRGAAIKTKAGAVISFVKEQLKVLKEKRKHK